MRLAHVVLAHRAPDQLAALLVALTRDGDPAFVHVDRRRPLAPFLAALREADLERDAVVLLPRVASPWGGFGLVDAALLGLRAALEARPRVDYVALHSGQDFPIQPREAIVARLEASGGAAFVKHLPYPAPGFPDGEGLDRLRRWYLRPSRRWSVPNRLTPFLPERRIPAGLEPHGGSQFWWLPEEVGRQLLALVDDRPELVGFFRRSFVPDETFFSTLVMSGPSRERVVDDDLRFISHPDGEAHPRTLGEADLPVLARSEALVARKFDFEEHPGMRPALQRLLAERA